MSADIDDEIRTLLAQGLSQREIARRLDIPRTTLQDRLKRQQVHPVHRGAATPLPRRPPEVDLSPQTPAELDAIKLDLLEVAAWWRARKMWRVDPSGPRNTQRWTVHVDTRWIEQVKEMAEAEGVSQMAIVDRAFRAFFEGRSTSVHRVDP